MPKILLALADHGDGQTPPSLDAFDQTFRAAVGRQTDVEVDFGVFLSGGIDSSLVSAVVRSLHPKRPLKAYTLRFEEESFDEGSFAEAVARQLKMEMVTVWVKPDDVRDGLKSLDPPGGRTPGRPRVDSGGAAGPARGPGNQDGARRGGRG